MPTFLILRRVGKTGGKPLTISGARLVIGRAPECGLALDDPLVSPTHASIEWKRSPQPGGAEGGSSSAAWACVLRDEGSETGTFLDDRPIPAGDVPLGSGARLLIGRVPMQATVNAETQEVALSTIERTLSGERVLAATLGARRRPLWRRPPALAAAGFILGVVPFVTLAALDSPALFNKGALARVHQVDARAGGVALVRCDACHTPFRGTEGRKCAACHERAVGPGTQHPISNAVFADASCAGCHVEHGGADARLLPGHVPFATCRACHEGAHRDETGVGKPGASTSTGTSTGTVALERVPFGSFSHAEHVVGRIAKCEACHKLQVLAPATATATPEHGGAGGAGLAAAAHLAPRRDFAVMGYEGCTGCHEHANRKVAAHGTNQQCTACHAGPFERALAVTVASIERAPEATIPAQPHGLAAKECAPCHMDAKEALAARARSKPFDHFAHLSSLAPARPADVPDVVAQCVECHAGIVRAGSVAEARAMPPVEDCARCHTGGAIVAGAAPVVTTLSAVIFSHAAHAGAGRLGAPGAALPGGSRRLSAGARALHDRSCLACHAFGKDEPHTAPSLGASAQDCAACHTRRHEDAGLEQCAFCHKGHDDLFQPAPLERPGYGPIRFDHRSTTHATVACAECHGDVAKATSLEGLRYPRFGAAECRRCHAARAGGDLDCIGCHKMHAR